jgi:hypothetical protein
MSLRRLHVLVSRLPMDSRTQQHLYGDEAATWTPAGAQRHQIAHALATANWQRASGKGEKPKKPKPPRPRTRIPLPDDI